MNTHTHTHTHTLEHRCWALRTRKSIERCSRDVQSCSLHLCCFWKILAVSHLPRSLHWPQWLGWSPLWCTWCSIWLSNIVTRNSHSYHSSISRENYLTRILAHSNITRTQVRQYGFSDLDITQRESLVCTFWRKILLCDSHNCVGIHESHQSIWNHRRDGTTDQETNQHYDSFHHSNMYADLRPCWYNGVSSIRSRHPGRYNFELQSGLTRRTRHFEREYAQKTFHVKRFDRYYYMHGHVLSLTFVPMSKLFSYLAS